MATSLMFSVNFSSSLSPISTETCQNREQMSTVFGLSKTSFLCGNTKKLFSSQSSTRVFRFRKFKSLITASSYSNLIPREFREENLKDGLMDNYKNVPESLYGLTPSQMEMFASDDNPIFAQSAKLKEENLSSIRSYLNDGGQSTLCSMNTQMYRGGYSESEEYYEEGGYYEYERRRRMRRERNSEPPDLPSYLLSGRIVYLGMPIYPAVTELILAELLYLKFDDPEEPIYLYINSLGMKNEQGQIVGDDVDAYAIADAMSQFRGRIYTVNLACAYGQSAMLFSRGTKGYRFVQPSCSTKLYMPSKDRMNGQTTDMYIEARDLQETNNIFLELLSEGIGKPEEVLREEIRHSRYFTPQAAIDYGIADKVVPNEAGEPQELYSTELVIFPEPKGDSG